MSCEHSQKKSTNPARRLQDLYDAVSVSLSEMSEVYLASIRDRATRDDRADNPHSGKCSSGKHGRSDRIPLPTNLRASKSGSRETN